VAEGFGPNGFEGWGEVYESVGGLVDRIHDKTCERDGPLRKVKCALTLRESRKRNIFPARL
jgi:hypothetical protein